jgi:uncharacterized repeat protein (TIGR03803 family)
MSKVNWLKTRCAIVLVWAATATAVSAQTLTTLYSFDISDGAFPDGGLLEATDGNLYGTTGGSGSCTTSTTVDGCGTVFKISLAGTLTVLHTFCSEAGCPDGDSPTAPLIQATDGNFYGTTYEGGTTSGGVREGGGTIFRITLAGTLTTLYSFCAQMGCPDGSNPEGGLVQGTDGNFYGTTVAGGAKGDGTVFGITPEGKLTTLHNFCAGSRRGCPDGATPEAGLVQATDGNFYGTTQQGGANGVGSVFRITPRGALTALYSFCSNGTCTDGSGPEAPLIQGTDGNLYGTTKGATFSWQPGSGINGTVFKITLSGTLTTLYNFCSESACADGENPTFGLVQGTDGNFYGSTPAGGTTEGGATYGAGTLFKITSSGDLTTLYTFCSQWGCPDGEYPGELIQDTDGNFYGTTSGGGANDAGTVFNLSVGLGPFVEPQPTSGAVGEPTRILGTNLTGASSVTFNGTPATFTVEGNSYIKTTVPAGATTGTVQVVTPSGTLSSNVAFRVAP